MTKQQFQEMSDYLDTSPIEKKDILLQKKETISPHPPKQPLVTIGDLFPILDTLQTT